MSKNPWSRSDVLAAAALVLVVVAAIFAYQQLPERKANLVLEVPNARFVNRSPGQWLAAPTVVVKNDGSSRAERVYMEFQHWPLSWTGVVPPRDSFDISPGETKTFLISADTVADPDGSLSRGTHLYFAIRAKWVNSATGKPGCEVWYVDIRLAPGPEVGTRLPLIDVVAERPSALPAPEIGGCPRG
jgi:hypothetical protein